MPSIEDLRHFTQSLAMLDAIIQREWEGRYYSFNSRWDQKQQMASMRNGEGDSWFCVFAPFGAFLKGFDHESKMSPRNNYKHPVSLALIEQIYGHKPLTEGVVRGLNPKANLAELSDDLAEIGYPVSPN